MARTSSAARWSVHAVLAALVSLGLSACSSQKESWRPPPTAAPATSSYATIAPDQAPKPPYPSDPDPNATYCLCWVPPTYHEVPKVVCCKPDCCTTEKVFRRKVEFEEVCKPGCYTAKKSPDRCRTEEIVEACPPRKEWVRADCACGPCNECYKQVDVPPTYKCCEKTVTEEGVKYCAFTPPEYDVVGTIKTVSIDRPVHVPGEYRVEWCKECFQPGHWEWRRVMNCGCPPPPKPACPCDCAPIRRGDFSYAPPRD